jgi:predicted nucleic acid-binding protein
VADALFDTTVFIDYYRGDSSAKQFLDDLFEGRSSASFSAVTAFELWMGVSRREEELDFFAMLRFLEEAPVTAAAARLAASWLRDQSPSRAETLFRDALIAATASRRQEPVYTRNVRDFSRFEIDVRTY